MSDDETVQEDAAVQRDENAAVEEPTEVTEGEAPELDAAPAEEESTETEETPDVAALRKEAANHRKKARAAEQERDALASRVEALQRAEVERIVATKADNYMPFADPADFWRGDGVELAALVDEDGNLDAAKVREVASGVLVEHPHWRTFSFGDADAGKGGTPVPSATDQFGDQLQRLGGRAA